MRLPARRTAKVIAHTGSSIGLTALVSAVLGVVAWQADLIVVGVLAVIVVFVGAYILSRP